MKFKYVFLLIFFIFISLACINASQVLDCGDFKATIPDEFAGENITEHDTGYHYVKHTEYYFPFQFIVYDDINDLAERLGAYRRSGSHELRSIYHGHNTIYYRDYNGVWGNLSIVAFETKGHFVFIQMPEEYSMDNIRSIIKSTPKSKYSHAKFNSILNTSLDYADELNIMEQKRHASYTEGYNQGSRDMYNLLEQYL